MTSKTITAGEMLRRLQSGRVLDVRSEGEFAASALPNSFNIPILNNDHRHLVGLSYKNHGSEAAKVLGFELVGPLRLSLIEQWLSGFSGVPKDERFVMCWRGGLRSQIASSWIAEAGVETRRVEGGIKAVRREVLNSFETLPNLVVFGGFTGSGKTRLLSGLDPDYVLDLEHLARHRGSIFGRYLDSAQPSQATFENALGAAFFERREPYVCEAESRMIGLCCLPNSLKEKMDQSDFVLITEPVDARARNVFDEYVLKTAGSAPSVDTWFILCEHFRGCLRAIQRRLGGALHSEIDGHLKVAFEKIDLDFELHERWIRPLLELYYDRLYEHSLNRSQRRVIFEGNWNECHDFLSSHIREWRTAGRDCISANQARL